MGIIAIHCKIYCDFCFAWLSRRPAAPTWSQGFEGGLVGLCFEESRDSGAWVGPGLALLEAAACFPERNKRSACCRMSPASANPGIATRAATMTTSERIG